MAGVSPLAEMAKVVRELRDRHRLEVARRDLVREIEALFEAGSLFEVSIRCRSAEDGSPGAFYVALADRPGATLRGFSARATLRAALCAALDEARSATEPPADDDLDDLLG